MAADVLFDPYDPENSREITIESWTELAYDASGEVVKVYGRSDPVVVTDVRPLPSGTLVLVTLDADERQWVDALLASGRVIGLEPGDAKFGLPSPCYLYVGKLTQARVVKRASALERRWTLDVQMTLAPVVA